MADPEQKGPERFDQRIAKMPVEVQLKTVELIWGNPVIFGIMVLGILALAVICIPYAKDAKEIIIPAMSGIGGLAGGVAISKLSNK
jgi:hypothetical protein